MAKSEYFYLKGKGKWVRPHVPDPWGNYKMVLYPDAASLDLIRKLSKPLDDGTLGIKNVISKDEDGEYITIKRPTEKNYGGQIKGFAPPEVVDANNLPLRETNIGNGSDVTAKIVVYKHAIPGSKTGGPKGRACRWEALRVDNLVPYEGKKDFTDEENQHLQGMAEQSPGF